MRGITLVEIMIVLGLFTLLIGASIGPGLQDFKIILGQAGGTRMAVLARHARAEAMHGISHSLYFSDTSDALVIRATNESDESYPLAGSKENTASGTIQFLGLAGTIRDGAWEVESNSSGAITLIHSL
jgi:hypothetical protein